MDERRARRVGAALRVTLASVLAVAGAIGSSGCERSCAPRPSGSAVTSTSSASATPKLRFDASALQVSWSPHGRMLLLWSEVPVARAREANEETAPCTVSVFDLHLGQITAKLDVTCTAACSSCSRKGLDFEATGDDQLVAVADHDSLSVWELPKGRRLFRKLLPPNFIGVSWSPDASRLLLTTEAGIGELIGASDGAQLGRFEVLGDMGEGRAFYGSWDREGRYLLVSGDEAYSKSLPPMQIRDGRTGALRTALDLPGAASPRWLDGSRFVVSNERGLVAIVKAESGAADVLRAQADAPLGPHQAWAALSHDARHLAFVAGDARLELWNLADGSHRELLRPAEAEWVGPPSFSLDDAHIALTRGRALLLLDAKQAVPARRVALAEGEDARSVWGAWSPAGLFVVRRRGALVSYDTHGEERSRRPLVDSMVFLPQRDERYALLWGDEPAVLRLDDGARLELRFTDRDGHLHGKVQGKPGTAALDAFFRRESEPR